MTNEAYFYFLLIMLELVIDIVFDFYSKPMTGLLDGLLGSALVTTGDEGTYFLWLFVLEITS